jgi:tetratricopeptide (TPR) repeat protein
MNTNKLKGILTSVVMLTSAFAFGQKTKVTSAELLLSRGEAESVLEAKQYMDQAAANETTKNWNRMWLVRSMVYTRVMEYRGNELLAGQSKGAGYISAYSMTQFWKSADKKRAEDEETARFESRNAFGVAFNEAEETVSEKFYDSGIKYYQLLMFLYDKLDTADQNDLETKGGINAKYLTDRMATIAIFCENKQVKMEVLTELMDKGSKSPVVYEALSKVYMEMGDTAMAEKIVRRALDAAPGDNGMFQLLVNYYVTIDRVDLLFDDVTKQIEANPTSKLYYTRGYLYERREDFDKAMQDYREAIALDEFNYDAQYNLGVALLKYESRKLYDKKVGATGAARTALDQQLRDVFTQARNHLEMAAENKAYTVEDQINIFKALKTAALELDDKDGAAEYQTKIDALEAVK